jgi:FkbM family methyltransferase
MANMQVGTFPAAVRGLLSKGIRYSTVIDVGCADGSFFLQLFTQGLFPGAVPFNIDANDLYEDSLRAIKAAVGGDFRITAITDHEGEVELTIAAHPYWFSLRPENDAYWSRLNNLSSTTRLVPATTLDALRKQLALTPPYLLKLDVQGAEEAVLRGAANLLKDTHVVVCEADMDDFQDINRVLLKNDFLLYDLTYLNRVGDGRLAWFHPVYVNRAISFVRPKEFWEKASNEEAINLQVRRRERILKENAAIIARIRDHKTRIQDQKIVEVKSAPSTESAKSVRRNEPCPCGSGMKYKHCCGAFR